MLLLHSFETRLENSIERVESPIETCHSLLENVIACRLIGKLIDINDMSGNRRHVIYH